MHANAKAQNIEKPKPLDSESELTPRNIGFQIPSLPYQNLSKIELKDHTKLYGYVSFPSHLRVTFSEDASVELRKCNNAVKLINRKKRKNSEAGKTNTLMSPTLP